MFIGKRLLVLAGVIVVLLAFYAGYSLYWHLMGGGGIVGVNSDCVAVVSGDQSSLPSWINNCGKGPKVIAVNSSVFTAHPEDFMSAKYPVLIYGPNLDDALRFIGGKMHVSVNGTPDGVIVYDGNTLVLVYKGVNLAFILENLPRISIHKYNSTSILAAAPYKGATVINQFAIYRENKAVYTGILTFVSSYLPKSIRFQTDLAYRNIQDVSSGEVKSFQPEFVIPPIRCQHHFQNSGGTPLSLENPGLVMSSDNYTIEHICSRKFGHPVIDEYKLGLLVNKYNASITVYPLPNIIPGQLLSIIISVSK